MSDAAFIIKPVYLCVIVNGLVFNGQVTQVYVFVNPFHFHI